tara:strand:+ start:1274 stop:1819 length:546 start_codon:yes stop_codon:yes gene_type:complete
MAITNASRLADFGSGIGTAGAVLQIDNANDRIGIGTTNPQNTLQVGIAITMNGMTGVITAQSFDGDGSALTGVANTGFINATQLNVIGVTTSGSFEGDGSALTGISGFATALSSNSADFLSNIFQTPEILPVGAGTSVQITGSSGNGNVTFTRFGSIHMGTGSTLTVSTGTTFVMNVLNVF